MIATAKLIYDDEGRLLFTKEMKRDYTILMPMMLPIHFTFLQRIFRQHGYNTELLDTSHSGIVDEGLSGVHNDTCYPALLVIGQLIDAVKSGRYDIDKTALIITQTGGGCRASNYIHLLRKALKRSSLEHIPVISFNIPGMEKNPGFRITIPMTVQFVFAVIYGDLLMLLANQTRPYELEAGATDRLVQTWIDRLAGGKHKGLSGRHFSRTLRAITADFAAVPIHKTDKLKVGVVGEIYIKYARLGNNDLEQLLAAEGAEVVVPGLLDFVLYMAYNHISDTRLYGIKRLKGVLSAVMNRYLARMQKKLIRAVKTQPRFRPPAPFSELVRLVDGYISTGNKMGEGWLLTAEMLELIHSGVRNIVCTQPFGCLPNHIAGKGMIRKLREKNEGANIVAIDYDPGATRINQENRIKLMLATARLNRQRELERQSGAPDSENACEPRTQRADKQSSVPR